MFKKNTDKTKTSGEYINNIRQNLEVTIKNNETDDDYIRCVRHTTVIPDFNKNEQEDDYFFRIRKETPKRKRDAYERKLRNIIPSELVKSNEFFSCDRCCELEDMSTTEAEFYKKNNIIWNFFEGSFEEAFEDLHIWEHQALGMVIEENFASIVRVRTTIDPDENLLKQFDFVAKRLAIYAEYNCEGSRLQAFVDKSKLTDFLINQLKINGLEFSEGTTLAILSGNKYE